MESLNCLIVEDEPLAAAILEDYIGQVPYLHYAGRCPDALRATEAMQTQAVDVLFLDINLPGIKGLDFLRGLAQPPQSILTTAYPEFALQGYDLNVVDYLLKPISFERFMQAVRKIRRPESNAARPSPRAFHFFNVNKKMQRVWLDEIVLLESLKEYVRIQLRDGSVIVTKSPLGSMESLLKAYPFVRVHRSFLISLDHVEAYSSTEVVLEGGRNVPIGRIYREVFSKQFGGNKTVIQK